MTGRSGYCGDGATAYELNYFYCSDDEWWHGPNDVCQANGSPPTPTKAEQCGADLGHPDDCKGKKDDNFNGCAGEGCSRGTKECTCTASCEKPSCGTPPPAKCDPHKPSEKEKCGDGKDNDCNGRKDEGCAPIGPGPQPQKPAGPPPPPSPTPPLPPPCPVKGTAGNDPIILSTESAATTPFTDFSVTALSTLSITRSYTSADVTVTDGSAPGLFGRGWHHDWEAALSCDDGECTVQYGLGEAVVYQKTGTAPSLDGAELWDVYGPFADAAMQYDSPGVLVRRPTGSWIRFLPDGSEEHFETVCDACVPEDYASPRCLDALQGGSARRVRIVDGIGNAIRVGYDRGSGLLFGLSDDLGHSLEVRSAGTCGPERAAELRYDGFTVATYPYVGDDLLSALDADGNPLRSYAYVPGSGGRLQAVLDESGTAVAEFAYDAWWRATAIIDDGSSVSIDYEGPGGIAVTEYFQGVAGPTSATSVRALDNGGHITSVSDGCACGAPQTFQWTTGRLTCSADVQGRATARVYDAQGRVTRVAEYAGACPLPTSLPTPSRDRQWEYGLTRPIAQGVSLPLDRITRTLRKGIIAGDFEETADYDPAAKTIDPVGYSCTSSSLPAGSVMCRRIEKGYAYRPWPVTERHATFYSYDGRGRVIRQVGPVNLDYPSTSDVKPVEERTYWPDDETLARRGRLHEVKRYASPTSAPLVTALDYDAFGPYQVRQPDGALTTLVKDGRGRVQFALSAAGRTETRYHDGAQPRLVVEPSGAAERFSYGLMGRLVSVEQLSGDPEAPGAAPVVSWTEVYAYDAAGNRIRTERRDANGVVAQVQERAFDVQHRVVRENHPELADRWRSVSYDGSGMVAATADEEGRKTTFTPDALGRVLSVTRAGLDATGAPATKEVARYTYAANTDELYEVKGGNGYFTRYSRYDFGIGVITSDSGFRGGDLYFTRDARGNLLQRKDNYVTVSYTYDGLNRVISTTAVNAADQARVTYTYRYDEDGAAGRLASVVEPERTVRFRYDTVGRLATERVEENGVSTPLVTEYRYGAGGALSEIVYPTGLRLAYDRDPVTREVTALRNAETGLVYAGGVARLAGGPVTSLTYANGKTLTQGFNYRWEPLSVATGPVTLQYGPTPAGDVGQILENGLALPFRYDFLDRLTESSGWFTYGYDGNGNLTGEWLEGTSLVYGYTRDRVMDASTPGATPVKRYAFAYDYQTNLSGVGKYNAAGTAVEKAICLVHDPLGRLVLAGPAAYAGWVGPDYVACQYEWSVSAATARFKYDFRNRRVASWKAATGEWVYTAFGRGGEPLAELAKTTDPAKPWRPVREYVWLDGKPIAQIERDAATGASRVYAVHTDAIGLPRALTSPSGATVWSARPARPYGDVTEVTTPDPETGKTVVTNLRLPGQYDERLLGSVGLQGPYYNWNRWYLPSVGRYLELDPIAKAGGFNGFYGPNWYGYAEGNPLRHTDPRGLAVYWCHRVANLPGNPGLEHWWIKTDAGSGGMGKCGAGVPGNGDSDSPYVTDTCINDHSNEPDVYCELIYDIDEQCVDAEILKCEQLGTWSLSNNCQTFTGDVIEKCRRKQDVCKP